MNEQLFETSDQRNASTGLLDQTGNEVQTQRQTSGSPVHETGTPLFNEDESRGFRNRWNAVQASFVDEPRQAVAQADQLVADTTNRLEKIFADERQKLEAEWERGEQVTTEDLRVALRKYRSFFDRLLNL